MRRGASEQVIQGKKIAVLVIVIAIAAATYFFFFRDPAGELQLIGTIDANQVIVSSKITGRIEKLAVDEGSAVKQGDLIAQLDTAELKAQEASYAALVASYRSRVAESQATETSTQGTTSSDVVTAEDRLQAAQASLAEAQADLIRIRADSVRTENLAKQGVASQQQSDDAAAALNAQIARVNSLQQQTGAAVAEVKSAQARTHQAHAAQSTVAAMRAQQLGAEADREQAQARLAYTTIAAPISGTVSVRVAREGEVVAPGAAIVTIIDLNDTWVRAPMPETYADKIGIGDMLKVRLPGGDMVNGKVIFKAVEADFATQRDVSRRKRDIKTVSLKLAVPNPSHSLVPGMTATVLVPNSKVGR